MQSNSSQQSQLAITRQLAKTKQLKQELELQMQISFDELGRRLQSLPELAPQDRAVVNKTAHDLLQTTKPKTRQVSIPANRIMI